jgi:hypothetical protein
LEIGVYPYININYFEVTGESTYSSHQISWLFPRTTDSIGQLLETNRVSSITPNGLIAIALDLGKRFSLDFIDNYTTNSRPLWDPDKIQYSSSDTNNIEDVSWGNSTKENARWILFTEQAVPQSESSVVYLDTLRVYPDITSSAPRRTTNSEWEFLGNILSDGNSQSYVTQLEYPVIAIDLLETFSVAFYSLLDHKDLEYSGSVGFNGWTENAYQSFSYSQKSNPSEVSWNSSWIEYSEETKFSGDIRWLVFKNELFDVNSGNSLEQKAATVEVSTAGDVIDSTGSEYKDTVDFTEYANWFEVPKYEENNIAKLEAIEVSTAEDFLYGSTEVRVSDGMESSDRSFIFDNDTGTYAILQQEPFYAWRTFGEVFLLSSGVSYSISGIELPPIETATIEDAYVEFNEVTVKGFGVTIPEQAIGKPNTIKFQTLIGEDPNNDSDWSTIFTESDLVEEVYTAGELDEDDDLELIFNDGDPYRANFDSPVTLSGFRVLLEDVSYSTTSQESTTTVGNITLYEESTLEPTVVEVSNDPEVRDGGRRSLKITYFSGNESSEKVTIGSTAIINPDTNWSIQDFLSLEMKIDHPDLLDLDNCFVRIGTDSRHYYEWSLSSIHQDFLSSELVRYFFRFKDATKQGIPGISVNSPDRSDLESKVDFKNGPIGFVELELNDHS